MCRQCVGVGGLFASLPSTAQTQQEPAEKILPSAPDGPRFVRPAIETDEGGLWALMDREERRLRRSPFVVRDAALNKYVHELACRLTGSHCPDIRVHIVRTPLFSASMAPNGMMQIWSGLLLRDAKSRAAFAQFVGLFGAVGSLVQLGGLASAFAFSREQEVRADTLGVRMMQRAGYEGQQAARVWDNLLGEMKIRGGDDVGKNNPMTATHPPTETRRDDLLRLAGEGAGETGQQAFEQIIGPHRFDWLRDEIKRGQFEESMVLFNRMLTTKPNDPELLYSRAETQRLRAGEQDIQGALNDLQRVTVMDSAPAEAFRSLGLLQRQRADRPSAVQAFETYLKVAPDAADASLIQNILSELRS